MRSDYDLSEIDFEPKEMYFISLAGSSKIKLQNKTS